MWLSERKDSVIGVECAWEQRESMNACRETKPAIVTPQVVQEVTYLIEHQLRFHVLCAWFVEVTTSVVWGCCLFVAKLPLGPCFVFEVFIIATCSVYISATAAEPSDLPDFFVHPLRTLLRLVMAFDRCFFTTNKACGNSSKKQTQQTKNSDRQTPKRKGDPLQSAELQWDKSRKQIFILCMG